jgi:Domain of unknown function (DUF5655)/Domain of unknown function (DUF4287)
MPRTSTKSSTTKKLRAKSIYGVHPGVQMVRDWIESLPAKTGKSLDQWLAFIQKEGPQDEKARREWLKKEHKFGSNSAGWLAERAEGKGMEDDDPDRYLQAAEEFVKAQYAGKKAALWPLYDALLKHSLALADDVKACPCQTMVPIYRNHVIAQIKPTTLTRIDFGLALGNTKAPKRVIDTGGFAKKDRITHRFEITSLADIDAEVKQWLKKAYELDVKK